MANNKIELASGIVLLDLTQDTVDAEHLAKGYTAHDASGALITGTMEKGGSSGPMFVKLWTNLNLTTRFNAQTISIDLTDYVGVLIVYCPFPQSNANRIVTTFCLKGSYGTELLALATNSNNRNGARQATARANGVVFEDCVYNGTTGGATNNTYAVPYVIFGVTGDVGNSISISGNVTAVSLDLDNLTDNTFAKAALSGQTVYFSAEPLDEHTVTGSLTVTEISPGTYSFVMPEYAVTITSESMGAPPIDL